MSLIVGTPPNFASPLSKFIPRRHNIPFLTSRKRSQSTSIENPHQGPSRPGRHFSFCQTRFQSQLEQNPRILNSELNKPPIQQKFTSKVGQDQSQIIYLNQMCNFLLRQQTELKQQISNQEHQIQQLKDKRRRNKPIKVFQAAVGRLEKERKIRHRSVPRSFSSSRYQSSEVALPLRHVTPVRNQQEELFTFRPAKQGGEVQVRRFPREVFTTEIRKRPSLPQLI